MGVRDAGDTRDIYCRWSVKRLTVDSVPNAYQDLVLHGLTSVNNRLNGTTVRSRSCVSVGASSGGVEIILHLSVELFGRLGLTTTNIAATRSLTLSLGVRLGSSRLRSILC